MSCGGVGAQKDATPEVQEMCNSVKGDAETKLGKQFGEFTAISYSTQVVAGTNFFVKVHVGNDQCVHLRIYRPLPPNHGNHELHSVQSEKSKADPIEYF